MEINGINYKEPIKINLGSGQRPFKSPEWINIDSRAQGYPVDIITDVKNLNMIPDNSVSVLVAHHLFEHIRLNDQEQCITEWYRILKPGGRLAIFVPDLRVLATRWLQGKLENFLYFVNLYGAYQGYEDDTHKWGYDEKELARRVSLYNEETQQAKIKWSSITRWKPEQAFDKEYADADIAQDFWILSLEFIK